MQHHPTNLTFQKKHLNSEKYYLKRYQYHKAWINFGANGATASGPDIKIGPFLRRQGSVGNHKFTTAACTVIENHVVKKSVEHKCK